MKIIALCGSMDFYSEMVSVQMELEEKGLVVYLPVAEEVKVDYTEISDRELARRKKGYIDEHLSKIRRSEAVLLVNKDKRGVAGYVGANTLMEAAFAYALDKSIFVLHELGEQPCRPELFGMQPVFLHGNASRVVHF